MAPEALHLGRSCFLASSKMPANDNISKKQLAHGPSIMAHPHGNCGYWLGMLTEPFECSTCLCLGTPTPRKWLCTTQKIQQEPTFTLSFWVGRFGSPTKIDKPRKHFGCPSSNLSNLEDLVLIVFEPRTRCNKKTPP